MSENPLIPLVRKQREIDASIKKVNKGLTDLRDERGQVEEQMREVLVRPEFATFHKMDLNDDSYIRIQRAGEWNKPWSLSKRELQVLLAEFFGGPAPKTAEECYRYITEAQAEKAKGTTMQFTRVERS